MLFLLMPLAAALDGNDELTLQLTGDVAVSGRFLRAEADRVVLSSQTGPVEVPTVLVESVQLNGEPMNHAVFMAELADAWAQLEAFRADPPPHPRPITTAGLSMLWSGAGHAALGDWKSARNYGIVEGVVLSSIALNVALENPQPIPSLIVVDMAFRVWSARESVRIARRRQDVLRRYDTSGTVP